MKQSLDLNPKPRDLCEHCGKKKGSHQANTFHCPIGRPGRANTYQFSTETKFSPTPPRICATIQKHLDAFEKGARADAWEQDQGSTSSAAQAHKEYKEARMALFIKIARLEAKLANAKLGIKK